MIVEHSVILIARLCFNFQYMTEWIWGISKGSITKSSSNAAMSSWDDNDEDTQTTSTTTSCFETDGLKKNMPIAEGTSGKSSYVKK
jgi:hypothetical protein